MGKTLKGKECGKGICQRKDGKYSARFCGKNGVRKEKHFSTLPEARNWLADQQYNDRHDLVLHRIHGGIIRNATHIIFNLFLATC